MTEFIGNSESFTNDFLMVLSRQGDPTDTSYIQNVQSCTKCVVLDSLCSSRDQSMQIILLFYLERFALKVGVIHIFPLIKHSNETCRIPLPACQSCLC